MRYFQIGDDLLILGLALTSVRVSTRQSFGLSGDSSFPVQRGGPVSTLRRDIRHTGM